MIKLENLSDDELRSLIGRSHAELSHRQRVRSAEFKDVIKLIEDHERQWRSDSPTAPIDPR